MNGLFQYLNFTGILLMAVLCAFQWKIDGQLNLQVVELDLVRIRQLEKINDQEKTIQETRADLEDFRQRITLAESKLKQLEQKLQFTTAERDRLRKSMDQWVAAVTTRDEALKKSAAELDKRTAERDDAIAKFNDLALKYNDLAKR